MNAIVGVCHFCEAHGPKPVFCTFTCDDEKHVYEPSNPVDQCNGCRSLGPETVFVTKDEDNVIYCSRESVPNLEVNGFLRQAAIRSITCEVSWSKDGGIVYFSDAKAHVLSLSFQLCDTRARGLKRWFSIVVLMKDKMLLLNITPLLSEHLQEIAKELQQLAQEVFNEEQKVCSQRALRLKTGSNYFGQSRSIMELTGQKDVFKKLHAYFTRMLRAGAMTYKETLYTSDDLLKNLNHQPLGTSCFTKDICCLPSPEECMPLRALENMLGSSVFRIMLYCTLTGIDIEIKTDPEGSDAIARGLSRLLPVNNAEDAKNIKIFKKLRITSSLQTCVLENGPDGFSYRWPGSLPAKCPTLMSKIESAISNSKLNDEVLHQHVKSMQLQWLGSAQTIKSATESSKRNSESVIKLKQVLGICPHDEVLVEYWIRAFCS